MTTLTAVEQFSADVLEWSRDRQELVAEIEAMQARVQRTIARLELRIEAQQFDRQYGLVRSK